MPASKCQIILDFAAAEDGGGSGKESNQITISNVPTPS